MSDMIIAVSHFTAGQVRELLGVDPTRIRVIPHGVRQPGIEANGQREKTILFVGALQLRKNVTRLVDAFEQIPPEWQLVLAGSARGHGADRILDRIARSPARARIRVTGYLPDSAIDELYRTASVFAFPSLDEGFGIPVLEAMAYGVPVVTSNRSALAEVAGDAALLINPNDTADLAGALTRLIGDAGLRLRLAAAGHIHARPYTWEQAVQQTRRVYQELAK